MNVLDDVANVIKRRIYEPQGQFYAMFMTGVDRKVSTQINTAAISYSPKTQSLTLLVNEEFWFGLTEPQKVFVLEHEVSHICFGHMVTCDFYQNRLVDNLATDTEIHEYIECKIEGGITLAWLKQTFPKGYWPEKAGRDHYYREIMRQCDEGGQGIQDKVDAAGGNIEHAWEQMTETEKAIASINMEGRVEQAAKSCGTVPGHIQGLLDSFVKPKAEFNWKAILRRFVTNSGRMVIKYTRSKPNLFFEDNRAPKVKFKNKMLWIIDTSGSVSQDELAECCNEMYWLHKQGYHIDTMCVDTTIHPIVEYKGTTTFEIHGRGGTDFDPAIEFFNKSKYDLAVYFTDGEAHTPRNANKPLLWVVSSRGTTSYVESHNGRILKIS